jgi:hypothetical protein
MAATLSRPVKRATRPLTAAQELMFFGVTFGVATVLHLAVLLDLSGLIGTVH